MMFTYLLSIIYYTINLMSSILAMHIRHRKEQGYLEMGT